MKIKISLIKENPSNPRKIDKDKFDKLVQSLKDFPEMLEVRPLVIDEDNIVLGGNMRLKALREAGIDPVPVTQVKDWSKEQKRQFVIKDNMSFGVWDWDMMANQYDSSELEEWGFNPNQVGMQNMGGVGEIGLDDLDSDSTLVFKFEAKVYQKILKDLESFKKTHTLDTNEEVLLMLLDNNV